MSRSRRRLAPTIVFVCLALAVLTAVLVVRDWGVHVLNRGTCTANVDGTTAKLTAEQARYASIIVAGSIRAGLPPRAASIALATAFQESGIRNLDYGHADSVGLFQQRPSQGWGSVAQIMNPYYATARFYQALAKVPGYTDMDIAVAAQQVQRSADGSLYAKHEQRARILASAMTGQTPAAWTCHPDDTTGHRWSRAELITNLGSSFGAQVCATAAPGAVIVSLPRLMSPATAAARRWAIANWAVANSTSGPVESVHVNGRRWLRAHADDGWQPDPDRTRNTVVISLTARDGS